MTVIVLIHGFTGQLSDFLICSLSYPVLHGIWLHISANSSQPVSIAMIFEQFTKLFRQLQRKLRILGE